MERIIEYVIRCRPGEISEMKCKVCGTVCDVERINVIVTDPA